MQIRGIDHIELYVGDAYQSTFYFGMAIGLPSRGHGGPETGLAGQRSVLLGRGDIQLLLTSGLTAEHPAVGYVRRHGDGVAVVAVEVDDATVAYQQLVSRGARSVSPPVTYTAGNSTVIVAEVAGFADVVHRLVERRGSHQEFLPGAIEMSEPGGAVDDKLLRNIDHLAICVPAGELDSTVAFYEEVFGFAQTFEEYIDVAGQGMYSKVVQSPSTQVTLVLIEPDPTRRPGQIDDFLRWHDGAGVQHLALSSADIIAAVSGMVANGVGFATTPAAYYDGLSRRVGPIDAPLDRLRDLGVLVDRDHGGQLLQIFTRSMHVRRTLFLELIERRGALTFGGGNIKALYEAKERELTGSPAAHPSTPVPGQRISTAGG